PSPKGRRGWGYNPDLKAFDSSRKNIAAGPYPTQRGTHRSIARKDGGVGLTSRPQGSRHQWRRSRGRTRIEIKKEYRCRSIPPRPILHSPPCLFTESLGTQTPTFTYPCQSA